jgi:replicative DNA helicase
MEKPEDNQDTPIEYQVFALSLRQEGAITHFADNLPDDIVGINHGQKGIHEFYLALLAYRTATQLDIVDPVGFKDWLGSETDIREALGGTSGVDIMMDVLLSLELSTVDSVVQLIKHKANKKKQIDYLQELQIILNQKGVKSDKDLARLSLITSEIRELENQLNYDPLEKLTTAIDISNRAESLLDIPSFLPTQFKSLNRAMGYTDDGGFYKGAVHAVIAPSGKGKSTFAKCLANNWVENGHTVLYVNFEEAVGHWERILMTQIIGKNVYAEAERWTPSEREKYLGIFRDKLSQWGNKLMVRHDPDTPYFEDLERWLRDIIDYAETPEVVIIDTIQSMFTKGGKGKPRWGEFEEMMVKLEKLARDMNCVLIITAQENSNRMKEKREVVQQSDTGGSLAIQQKCAVTIFITEKKLISGDDSEDENIMQLQIPKNRITGSSFIYNPPLVKYVDSRKAYEEYEPVNQEDYDDTSSLLDDLLDDEDFDI